MDREFNIDAMKGDFRVGFKNGIEAVSMRYCLMGLNDAKQTTKIFEEILEHTEYRIDKDNWIRVKEGNNYYPNGIENNAKAIEQLVVKFLSYLEDFFTDANK